MKTLKMIMGIILVLSFTVACQEDIPSLNTVVVPTNLTITTNVASDQSGNVTVTATADDALTIHVIFRQNAAPVVVSPGQPAAFRYTQSGQYSQLITVVAFGAGGTATSRNITVDLDVKLLIDPDILQKIAGDGTKRWVWNKEETGHWGADAAFNEQNNGFQAPPNSINPCAYDDVLTFSYDANDVYGYQLDTGAGNETLVGWADVNVFFPNATPSQFVDECRDISTANSTAVKTIDTDTSFLIYEEDGDLYLEVENSTLSFWSGATRYKILELTEDFLFVRGDHLPLLETIEIAYYHQFRPEDYDPNAGGTQFETLVWSDEFDVDGAPDPTNWTYDIGTGNNGWGNGELQSYTSDPENVIVENGTLKITARADGSGGYTSARLKSENLREFTYGRAEIRAKLPSATGTWPAIWALGANFDTVGWPSCGEIDIMEQTGAEKNTILSTVHFPGNSGGGGITDSTPLPSSTTEFHVYTVEWTADEIKFWIDDEPVHHTVSNDPSRPFNDDFFFIMNVAMGGSLGGTVDPSFTEDTMEIDYVRFFQ